MSNVMTACEKGMQVSPPNSARFTVGGFVPGRDGLKQAWGPALAVQLGGTFRFQKVI